MNYPMVRPRSAATWRSHAWPTRASLILSDVLVVSLALALCIWVRSWFEGTVDAQNYLRLWPTLGLFPLAYGLMGLYPGIGLNPAEEIRRTSAATTLVYLLLGSTTFLFKEAEFYSRAVFLVAWSLSLLAVPLARALIRHLFAARSWWGYPVLILGAGKTGEAVLGVLQQNPGIGLKAVGVFDDDPTKQTELLGVPVLGKLEQAPEVGRAHHIQHVIIAMPGASRQRLMEVLEHCGSAFAHLTLIPDLFGMASLWISAQDFRGMLGLEVRNNLLRPWDRRLKRVLDLIGVIIAGLLLLPLLLLIAFLIRLDSPGLALYRQERMGLDGRRFKVIKFRTMYGDGEQRLSELLDSDPRLKEEYQQFHKLRSDPRVTRIGAFLRRTSLDELPQLWNVLLGQMSLVGPRPYLERELTAMGGAEPIILKAPPGITGMWQVSGRNHTAFRERLNMDIYYVRNWSPWLDFYLLARTVWAAFWNKGAY